jgi:glutaconate CoA-transferase subunit A
MAPVRDKRISLSKAAAMIPDGAQLGTTGSLETAPIAFFKELIRQGRHDLHLVLVPSGGFSADLLIGAGAVRHAEGGAVALGEAGTAPNFRRAMQGGELAPMDST